MHRRRDSCHLGSGLRSAVLIGASGDEGTVWRPEMVRLSPLDVIKGQRQAGVRVSAWRNTVGMTEPG